jgi:hypothetical protein
MEVSEIGPTHIAADRPDFHLFFERPPMDQGDRWSSRPFRPYSTVQPPFAVPLDPVVIRRDKLRFIQNLWTAQALARTRNIDRVAAPRVLAGIEEYGLERAGELFGRAKCFWNVWQSDAWQANVKKVSDL